MRDPLLTEPPRHLYVTRAATLAYQDLTGTRFEEARRQLTERVLRATEDPAQPGTYLLDGVGPRVRAFTRPDGILLFVTKIVAHAGA